VRERERERETERDRERDKNQSKVKVDETITNKVASTVFRTKVKAVNWEF